MVSRARTAWKMALAGLTAGLLVIAVLQLVNYSEVHKGLCNFEVLECRSSTAPIAFEAQGHPRKLPEALRAKSLWVRASTALIRQACDGRWTAGFGARIQIDPLALGDQFVSDGACVDAFQQGLRVTLAGAQVRYGDCVVRLDPMRVEWSDALTATITAQTAPDAAAACSALLPPSLGDIVAMQLAALTVDLNLRYAIAYTRHETLFKDAPRQNSSAGGWVRHVLETMETTHDLRARLPGGSVSLRFASTTGSSTPKSSPELTLVLGVEGGVLNLLPEDMKQAITPARPVQIQWRLGHEDGRVLINDQIIQQEKAVLLRAPGPTVLTASECGTAVTDSALSLYFVEADDRGKARDPEQAQALFRMLDKASADGQEVIVALFVHGWQHSAAPGDSYVCDYAKLISAVETMEIGAARMRGRPRKVVGVYVGWPGRLYPSELANAITFWNRLQVADRLGAEDGLLRQVIQGVVRRLPVNPREQRADRRSLFIIAGHSMGGRAVFHAVRDGLLSYAGAVTGARRPDLVLLVNPAFSAELYRGIHEQERRCLPIGFRLLSFSSESDAVTRQVYPGGQALTFNYATRPTAPFLEHIYTAANFDEFLTHRLRLRLEASRDLPSLTGEQTIVRGFQRVPEGSNHELYSDNPATVFHLPKSGRPTDKDRWYSMRLDRIDTNPSRCPDSGSKVIEVDARILPDHGTIFTPPFVEYAARVLNRSALDGGK